MGFGKIFLCGLILVLSSCAQRGVRDEGLTKDPDSRLIIEARILHESGEIEAAISSLRTWVDTSVYREKHDVAYELIVQWMLEVGQRDEAKRIASFFLSQHPRSLSAQKIIELFDHKELKSVTPDAQEYHEPEIIEDKSSGENPLDSVLDKQSSSLLHLFHHGQLAESYEKLAESQALSAPLANLKKEIETIRSPDMKSLGVILPLSGALMPFGKKVLMAMGIAWALPADQIAGPISVMKNGVRIVIVDSKGETAAAQNAVDHLVKVERVAMIVGEITNDASLLIAQRCQQYGVPLLSLSRHPTLASMGDYVFVFNSSSQQHIEHLVNYAMTTMGQKRFAILFPRHNYGMTMSQLFFDEVVRKGGSIAALEAYDAHETTFATPVKKLVGKYYLTNRPEAQACAKIGRLKDAQKCRDSIKPLVDFDALFVPEFNKLALIVPALMQEDLLISSSPRVKSALSSATKIDNPQYVQLLGPNSWNEKATLDRIVNFVDGAYFVDSLSFEDSDELKRFAAAFTTAFGQAPSVLEAFAHDAASLALSLLSQANIESRKVLRERIAQWKGKVGVLNSISFLASGELDAIETGFLIKDGKVSAQSS